MYRSVGARLREPRTNSFLRRVPRGTRAGLRTSSAPSKTITAVQRSAPQLLQLALIALSGTLLGCSQDVPPPGRILVKNDSQDREYNVITVSGGGAFKSLKPGERFTLPAGTKTFAVTRRYKEYTRSYSVVCPPIGKSGVFVKLIDIHVNRIAGGCKTVSASKE